ncbi:unnamed protein product [Effrenium voratum]|nr:unnamed protein product [Effrenium voratum]
MTENLSVGMRLHAMYKGDSEYYPAQITNINNNKGLKKKRTPVKVHYMGYGEEEDAWLPLDMLKCKALKGQEEAKPAKAAAPKAKAKAKAKAKPEMDYSALATWTSRKVWGDL